MIKITEQAKNHIKNLIDSSDEYLKLMITSKGCNGHMYDLSFTSKIDALDEKIKIDDNKYLYVDKKSILFLFNTEIDWVSDTFNSGLKFNNPNVTSMCGCGESVGFN